MVVNRQSAKPRGYAFVEFDHERDMHGEFYTVFQSLLLLCRKKVGGFDIY